MKPHPTSERITRVAQREEERKAKCVQGRVEVSKQSRLGSASFEVASGLVILIDNVRRTQYQEQERGLHDDWNPIND